MGYIDPTLYIDSEGVPNLVWKTDGNAIGVVTTILAHPLDASGTVLTAGTPPSPLTARHSDRVD